MKLKTTLSQNTTFRNLKNFLISLFISSCCTKGCNSYCKCEAGPDKFMPSLDPKYVEILKNLEYQKQVFKNDYNQIDTLKFNSLTYESLEGGDGNDCRGPKQTCCTIVHSEIYYVKFTTKTVSIKDYHSLLISSSSPESGIDSHYVYGLNIKDSLKTVFYKNVKITDALINISTINKDTLGLISKSKGLLMFTDDRNQKWRRIL